MTAWRRLAFIGIALLAPLLLGAALPEDALTPLRYLAIQHNGRLKPFDSFAREVLEQITGSPRWHGEDPVETVLAMISAPDRWQDVPLIAIPFHPLREPLGLGPKTTHVSLNELIATRTLMRRLPPIVEKRSNGEKLTMLDNETWDAFERFSSLSQLFEQKLHIVPPASATERSWLPVSSPDGYLGQQRTAIHNAWTATLTALRDHDAAQSRAAAVTLSNALRQANPGAYPPAWRLHLEVLYNHAAPFRVARWLYGLAILGFLLSLNSAGKRWGPLATGVFVAAFFIHGTGIALRVILGGRPPVSNFFETMLWLPFVAVTLALIFERVYRVRYFGLAAASLAAMTLLLAEHVPLDSSISPVVAVLRSNLWLTVHVLTIVASYGALALATAMAHIYGWIYVMPQGRQEVLPRFDTLLYRSIQVGVVLLAAGIMLGAVWANASWGRYWGWDPKETWALITLLWFLALLHGRFAGWISGVGVALGTIGGFFLLLMTYYGVSFYLVGLHSYAGGHAKPLPHLLIGYLLLEVAFMAVVGVVALRHRRPA